MYVSVCVCVCACAYVYVCVNATRMLKCDKNKKCSQFGQVAGGRLLRGRRRRLWARGGSRPPPSSVRAPPARALDDPLDVHVNAVHVIVGGGRERPAHGFPKVVARHGTVQPVVPLHRAPAQEFHLDRGAELGGAHDSVAAIASAATASADATTAATGHRGRARAATPLRVECLPAPTVAEL